MTDRISVGEISRRLKMPGLHRQLSILFIATLISLATTLWLVTLLVDRSNHNYAERQSLAWAEFASQHISRIEELALGAAPLPKDIEEIEQIEKFGDVFRFKLFDPNGVLRFASDDPLSANQDLNLHNPSALSVVETLRPLTGFADGRDQPNRPDLYSETYLPVIKNDRVVAILEVYINQTEVYTQTRRDYLLFGMGVLLLAALSFAGPLIAISKVLARLRKTNDLLEIERERAIASSNAKSEFISMVSHELRTPLTSIKVPLELLRLDKVTELSDKGKELVAMASKNANILLSLVNDILDFQKIGSGKMKVELQSTDIVEVVRNAVDTFQGYGANRSVEFVLDEGRNPIMVDIDAERITQVVGNLLSNGAKFSKPGDKVNISVAAELGAVRVSVKDNGCGIAQQNHELIFEKFAQADSSDARAAGGTGLGLAIAKEIVETHGGKIGFKSKLGEGSEFFFDLPYFGTTTEQVPDLLRSVA